MRILFVPEFASFGGTRSFFLRLLSIHKKYGYETGVVLEGTQQEADLCERLHREGVAVYPAKDRSKLSFNPLLAWMADIRKIFRAFKHFVPDLIVVSNGTPGIMLGALIFPAPVLFILHTYPEKYPWPFRLIWCLLSLFPGNKFVTVSKFSARSIHAHMGIHRDRIELVYNCFTRQVLTKQIQPQLVLTLGHVVGYKNPEVWLKVALRVIKERPETRFVWLGDGALLQQMRHKVQQEGCGHAVFFEGFRADVDRYFEQASIYFQPSMIENHAISVIDAMASGLPCVASNIGGTPESVVDQETGYLCDPNDIEGFANRLLKLLDDSDLLARMGAAGKKRAENLFSPETQEQAIVSLYQKLAEKRLFYK